MHFSKGNAVVGQSGGPTSVINASLAGVIIGSCKSKCIDKLYGMQNGIEGLILGRLIDLSILYGDGEALSILQSTPACALGSCRKRLPEITGNSEVYEKIFDIFKSHNIRYFFYIGGNDSMDTVHKLNQYAKKSNYEINFIGIPKTIDNDLVITDHTPGYGSASKFIATVIKEISLDVSSYLCNSVTVVEIMGRDTGWLTCAAGLPKYFGSHGADLMYLPEIPFDNHSFISSLNELLIKKPSILVAVSEGIKYSNGEYVSISKQGGIKDAFGHEYLSGSANVLKSLISDKIGCKVRSIELNLPQRCAAHMLSLTDVSESVQAGKFAVRCAENGISGKMVAFKRKNTENYEIELICEDVRKIANQIKYVPSEFISSEGNYVTKKCMEYLAPLIQGEINIKYENGLPVHFKIKDDRGREDVQNRL